MTTTGDALRLTGRLDADLQAVHDRGSRPREVEALLRAHAGWVERMARDRWRRFRRAHAAVGLDDAEHLVRIAVWAALEEYRYICPAGCTLRRPLPGAAAGPTMRVLGTGRVTVGEGDAWRCRDRAEWEAHAARRHRGQGVRPGVLLVPDPAGGPPRPRGTDIGHFVRLSAANAVNLECRRHYKAKRIAPRSADLLPAESVAFLGAVVRPARDAADDALDAAVAPGVDVRLQLRELAEEARVNLAPAARRMLHRLVEGEDLRDAAASEAAVIGDRAARASAKRAQSVLRAFAERTWTR